MVGSLVMVRKVLALMGLYFFFLVGYPPLTRAARMLHDSKGGSHSTPKLRVSDNHVEIDNGIVRLQLTNPEGAISAISYNGIRNLLEYGNKESQRGYYDIVWSGREDESYFYRIAGTSFSVVQEAEDQIEVSFYRTWNQYDEDDDVPLNIDMRYILRRGDSGFYSYAIFDHPEGWPALNIDEARIAFKLHQDMFHFMAVSDAIQRIMPTNEDRTLGHILDYKEAVLLTNTANPTLKGEVDDKYQYSYDNKNNRVHGWISNRPHMGFWVITPSFEFRAGGPVKADLSSHVGPTSLAIFFSNHYAGPTFGVRIEEGEPWKKVFGPVFVYLNSDPGNDRSILWEDAKQQMLEETEKWPYDFPQSKDFPHDGQRGVIQGRLLVHDWYMNEDKMPAQSAFVGLAPPGGAGSWQDESKGYQFWTQTDENGSFTIKGVRADNYNLYAWVPGFIGDYKYENNVTVTPGKITQTGDLVYNPPRNGTTIWEIGIPDRTAAEFFIPDPAPGLMNFLDINGTEKFRQYGLWDRYTDFYPNEDLIYRVTESDYTKDWFFAHVNRKIDGYTYNSTTWQILFELNNVSLPGEYTLWIALASASMAEIQVRINNPYTKLPHFTTGRIGRDNAIARHGIHGRYWLFSAEISGSQLVNGTNTIYLKQARGGNPFTGVMYDYIRLEGPRKGTASLKKGVLGRSL